MKSPIFDRDAAWWGVELDALARDQPRCSPAATLPRRRAVALRPSPLPDPPERDGTLFVSLGLLTLAWAGIFELVPLGIVAGGLLIFAWLTR